MIKKYKMTEVQAQFELWGTKATRLVNSQAVAEQLNITRDEFMKLLSEKLGVQCYLSVHDEELLIPGRWTHLKLKQTASDFEVITPSKVLLEFILKMNAQSDCFSLEEDIDKYEEVKVACQEKSLAEVMALVDNLDLVDTSLPEWQVLQMALN